MITKIALLSLICLASVAEAKEIHHTALQYMPTTIDSVEAGDTNSQFVVNNCFDGLVSWNEIDGLQPQLAKNWNFSSDRKTIVFNLRENIKFSDGSLFSATDVKAHFDRLIKHPVFSTDFKNVADIKVVNTTSVKFEMKMPSPYFFFLLAGSHSKIVKLKGREVIGIGPFIPVIGKKDIRFSANKDYWGDKPKIDIVVLSPMSEKEAVAGIRAGIVDDMVLFSFPHDEQVPKNLNIIRQNMWATWAIVFDQNVKPFDQLAVRKAVSQKIVSKEFLKLFEGNSEAFGIQALGMPGFVSSALKSEQSNSPQIKGITISITIPSEVSHAEMIAGWLKERSPSCCKIEPVLRPFADIMKVFGKGKMGAVLISLNAEYPDPSYLIRSTQSTASNNFMGLRGRYYDQKIEEIELANENADKANLIKEVNVKLIKDAALIPLMHITNIAAMRSCVSGIKLNPVSEGYFSLREAVNRCN